MRETGLRNGAFGADKFGLKNLKQVHWNLRAPQLYQYSLSSGEAVQVLWDPQHTFVITDAGHVPTVEELL